jgi:hypothetical protein
VQDRRGPVRDRPGQGRLSAGALPAKSLEPPTFRAGSGLSGQPLRGVHLLSLTAVRTHAGRRISPGKHVIYAHARHSSRTEGQYGIRRSAKGGWRYPKSSREHLGASRLGSEEGEGRPHVRLLGRGQVRATHDATANPGKLGSIPSSCIA